VVTIPSKWPAGAILNVWPDGRVVAVIGDTGLRGDGSRFVQVRFRGSGRENVFPAVQLLTGREFVIRCIRERRPLPVGVYEIDGAIDFSGDEVR